MQLLALSDLLATSSEGQCKNAENVCQTIYTVNELVRCVLMSSLCSHQSIHLSYLFIDPFAIYSSIYLFNSIISSQEIPIERKKPFARLLNWAYLSTEKDSLVSVDALSKNE